MARSKRQYGSGCVVTTKGGVAIRWRQLEIAPDGRKRRVLRYESLGRVPLKHAAQVLAARVAASGKKVSRSRLTFAQMANQWMVAVLPMYKKSTQMNHRHIALKHLIPRFGDQPMCEIHRQDIQVYVAYLCSRGYAPKSVDHVHDVLSAILRTAVEWGHLDDNPARGVRLPKLHTVREKWVLSIADAARLLERLPALPHAMVGLALLTGLRRGEVFALRWRDVDANLGVIRVREAVYEGNFGTPKTEAGKRTIPLSDAARAILVRWKPHAKSTALDQLVFATRTGRTIFPKNVLDRWVTPVCADLGLPRATWLTFRRTYATWAHEKGVPLKIVAQILGHARVDVTINTYTQVQEASVRAAVAPVGQELFSIVQSNEGSGVRIH